MAVNVGDVVMTAGYGEAVEMWGRDIVEVLEILWSGAAEARASFILCALAGESVEMFAPAVSVDHRQVKDDILFGVKHFTNDLFVKVAESAAGTAKGHAMPSRRGGRTWRGGEAHGVITVICTAR